MQVNNQKALTCLPENLLAAIDRIEIEIEKQISRSAFIRESVIRNLYYYNKYERGPACFPRNGPEFEKLSDAIVSID
jgi:hypothetical protein